MYIEAPWPVPPSRLVADGLDWQAVAGQGSTAQAQKTSSQPSEQFALSQRVSGPPCRAPAVATLLLKRKTLKPTIAALDGKMRTWRPPLAEIGTGRHALAIYWPNSGHGERHCIATVRGHGTTPDKHPDTVPTQLLQYLATH